MIRELCLGLLAVAALGAQARSQTVTTIFRFDGTDGAANIWRPAADGQGNLYGTTMNGGPYASSENPYGIGTLYKFTPGVSRTFETLHSFAGGTDGATPMAGPLYDASAAMLYGTTEYGGSASSTCTQGCGTFFSYNPATGTYAVVHAFAGADDQAYPVGPLTLGGDGTVYGTTKGTNASKTCAAANTCGTVFKYDPVTGTFTTLHSFNWTDGAEPQGPLVFGAGGLLFGATQAGGEDVGGPNAQGYGAVYSLDPTTGATNLIFAFPGITSPDGLAADPDDNLYVTANLSGRYRAGRIIKLVPNGDGSYTSSTLYSFGNGEGTGSQPVGSLAYDSTKKVFYGVAGGGLGMLYQIDPDSGVVTTLYNFLGGNDGGFPDDGILVNLGQLYGGTVGARQPQKTQPCLPSGCGTLYRFPRF